MKKKENTIYWCERCGYTTEVAHDECPACSYETVYRLEQGKDINNV